MVDHIANFKVGWLKAEDQTVLWMHDRKVTQNVRISVTHDNRSTWQLHIRQVKESDRGCYMCQINTAVMKKQIGCIDVYVPPDILYNDTSGDVTAKEGSNVTLVCKATGHPAPNITWRREDAEPILMRKGHQEFHKVESYDGSTLPFLKVERRQMGVYLCIANNNVPPAVSKRIILSVDFPPMIQVPNQLLGTPLHKNVQLECRIEAFPNSVNVWTKNDELIFDGSKFTVIEKRTSYFAHMMLKIRNFEDSDQGHYKCISTNSVGKTEATVRLYVISEASRTGSQKSTREDGSDAAHPTSGISSTLSNVSVVFYVIASSLLQYEMR